MNYLKLALRYIPHVVTVAIALTFFSLNNEQAASAPESYEGYNVFPAMVEGHLISIAILLFPAVLTLLASDRKAILKDWFAKPTCTVWNALLIFIAMAACSFGLLAIVDPAETQQIIAMFQVLEGYQALVIATSICVIVPFVEEVLFRGVLMQRLPPTFALYFSSVIFALAHGSSAFLWPLFLTGWCLGKVRQATNSLWVSTCCHGIFNALSLFIAVYDL
jgi:membrane protease YdiL (CAAX protease family)